MPVPGELLSKSSWNKPWHSKSPQEKFWACCWGKFTESGTPETVEMFLQEMKLEVQDCVHQVNGFFERACSYGNIKLATWFWNKFEAHITLDTQRQCILYTYAYDHWDTLQWLVLNLNLLPFSIRHPKGTLERTLWRAFVAACGFAPLETVQWLANQFQLDRKDVLDNGDEAFLMACTMDRLDIVQWLSTTYGFLPEMAIEFGYNPSYARSAHRLKVLKWLGLKLDKEPVDEEPDEELEGKQSQDIWEVKKERSLNLAQEMETANMLPDMLALVQET